MESLKNKVVIITGSASGIGEATAVMFAKHGSKVVLVDKDEVNLLRVSQLCEQSSPDKYKPLTVLGDITEDACQTQIIKKTVEVFRKLDVLVNNAGQQLAENILSDNFPKIYDSIMNVNSRAPLMLTRLALPLLIESKGCVVNTTSVGASRWIVEDSLAYCASKAALESITKILAHDFGPKGVRVVAVSPGLTLTNMTKLHMDIFDEKQYPLRRHGYPDDIANVICFLASSGASFVTGTSIVVDGGYSTK